MPAHNERSQVSTFIPTLLKKLKPFSSILLQKTRGVLVKLSLIFE